MSGIEVAGITLGILPLLVSAVENYKKALAPIIRYVRFEGRLRVLEGRFIVQQALYHEEALSLLCSALGRHRARAMIADPSNTGWQDQDIERELSIYLGSVFEAIKFSVRQIEQILLQIRLEVEQLTAMAKQQTEKSNKSTTSRIRVAQKLAFGFSGAYRLEEYLIELASRNCDFRTLIDLRQRRDKDEEQASDRAVSTHRNPKAVQQVQQVQKASKFLYKTLQGSCCPNEQHKAYLNLVPRVDVQHGVRIRFEVNVIRPPLDNPLTVEGNYHLTIESSNGDDSQAWDLLKLPERWKDEASRFQSQISTSTLPLTSLFNGPERMDKQASKTSLRIKIQEKFKRKEKLFNSGSGTEREYDETMSEKTLVSESGVRSGASSIDDIGDVRVDKVPRFETNNLYEQVLPFTTNSKICIARLEENPQLQLSLYLTAFDRSTEPKNFMSLQNVLDSIKTRKEVGRLSEHERYRFARLIALAALQYHGTPWSKQGSLRSEDMYLLDYTHSSTMLTEPYVKAIVENSNQTPLASSDNMKRPWIPNPSGLGLAVLLIEVALEKSFYQLQLPSELSTNDFRLDADYTTAQRLLNVVGGYTSPRYQNVVGNCLGNFCSQEDLGSDKLCQRYHQDVICELLNLEQRCAKLSFIDCDCINLL